MRTTNAFVVACLALTLAPMVAQAVIVYGDPAAAPSTHRNLSAPAGVWLDTGWQFEGTFGSGTSAYTGTPIAANAFITAHHVGAVSDITYNGITYSVVGPGTQIGTTDLQVWKISGNFPKWAPLYQPTDGALSGKSLVVFGRGVQPGTAVNTTKPISVTVHNGWQWGAVDGAAGGALSWGTNQVDGVYTDPTLGKFVVFSADSISGINEGTLVDKDSGGGVFVQGADGAWKLAGINYGVVPSQYSLALDGSNSFNAAIFNTNALYAGPPWASATPQTSFASSISDSYTQILQAIPEPSTLLFATASALFLASRRRRAAPITQHPESIGALAVAD